MTHGPRPGWVCPQSQLQDCLGCHRAIVCCPWLRCEGAQLQPPGCMPLGHCSLAGGRSFSNSSTFPEPCMTCSAPGGPRVPHTPPAPLLSSQSHGSQSPTIARQDLLQPLSSHPASAPRPVFQASHPPIQEELSKCIADMSTS